MVNYTYSKLPTINFNTTPASIARSATGSVYAVGDTTYTTPLNMTLVVGGSVVTSISSDANGLLPDFTLLDRTSCVWKQTGVSFATVLTTSDPVPGPQGATGGTGATGAQGVPGDVSTWKPTTFYPLNTPVTNPSGDLVKVTTAHTSTGSYDAAKFSTPYDAAVQSLVNTPGSATQVALSATLAPLTSLVRPPTARRANNPVRTMLTAFQSGHGFSQAVTSSYNYNDTTDFVMGSQSAFIVTNGTGGQAILTKSAAVTALNMTGKVFAILVKVTNSIHLNRITMLAGSSGFANNFQIQAQASNTIADQEITPEGRWSWVTLPWNPSATGGTPDRTNITDLRIAAVDDNTGQLVKVQVQAIATQVERPAAFPNGVVSIGFDDNWISQKTYGTSYMDKYGYPATIYSIVDLVGTSGRHTLDDLKRVEEYSGGEVAAHSWSLATHNLGFTGIPTAQLDQELRQMKAWMIDNNFQGRDLLAYPLGNFNASVIDTASKYYSFARTVNIRQQETLPPGGAYTCRAQSSTNTVTLAQITAQIDAAYANGSWLNLLYHDITTGTASGSVQVTQANFQGAIDYLNTKGIPVRTVSQVLKAVAP